MENVTNQINEIIIETKEGKLRGQIIDGVMTFLGIPYGADTSGENRFRPPMPVTPWEGVRDALKFGSVCFQQPATDFPVPERVREGITDYHEDADNYSEDCLNLNVWAPANPKEEKLPVLVWLHGGAFSSGSANFTRTNGHNLASRGDVVMITVNQRVGALGYLYVGGASDDPEMLDSGNCGTLDLIASLKWIQRNIAAFHGDPNNVTIFGYSGGGGKVISLMKSPAANGLYHRAICQSGEIDDFSKEEAATIARKTFQVLKVDPNDTKAIQKIPPMDLVEAVRKASGGMGPLGRINPVTDGRTIPEPGYDSIRHGKSGQVPLICGHTQEEVGIFLSMIPIVQKLNWFGLKLIFPLIVKPHGGKVLKAYRKFRPDYGPDRLLYTILTQQTFGQTARALLEAHSEAGQCPSYAYISEWVSSVLPELYAGHGIEEILYLDNAHVTKATREGEGGPELAKLLSSVWVQFAKTGNPNTDGIPDWLEYNGSERNIMYFNTQSHLEVNPNAEEVAFWKGPDAPTGGPFA